MKCRAHITALMLVAMMFGGLHTVSVADEAAEEKAVEAAKKWLDLTDNGEYAKSWETAAEYFKDAVSEEQWKQAMTSVRKPLGEVKSRELKSKEYASTLPGAPDGEYVVIQFVTSFENKTNSVETIIPMLDKDGQWRVSGYFIK